MYGLTLSGKSSREEEMKWFGQVSESNENQNSESAVSSLPLFGIPCNEYLFSGAYLKYFEPVNLARLKKLTFFITTS